MKYEFLVGGAIILSLNYLLWALLLSIGLDSEHVRSTKSPNT